MASVQICPVPYSQRPSNEYNCIKNSFKFSWIFQNSRDFFSSLMKPVIINYVISYGIVFNIYNKETLITLTLKFLSELFLGTSLLSVMYLLQSYLACIYVYDRLMTSTISYEESGWYDGQTWIKSKEILLQDRLIGKYELEPKIRRLKMVLNSLMSTFGISLFIDILN
jgi:hypothetical protein